MRRMPWIGVAVLIALAAPAQATRICARLDETVDDGLHTFALVLEADADADVYYAMAGEGVTTESSRTYSPSKGTLVLHRGRLEKPWSFGTNVDPGASIDIVAEVRAWPKDVFTDEPPPLLASFPFRRTVPEDGEPAVPKGFGAQQCADVQPPPASR